MITKSFALSFAKNVGWFCLGFVGMIGFINVMAWLFGKTVAIWIGWITVILMWVGLITAGVAKMPALSDTQVNDLKKATDPLG